ncbi:MAG: hypothetical protein JKY45_13955 [Emcibacter sp.]|nr:hypothetical protein [Emcibacter sp.]
MLKIVLALSAFFLMGGWTPNQVPTQVQTQAQNQVPTQILQTPLLSDLDIPLMQGFQEEEDSRVVFDTPDGRIIVVRAVGQKDGQEVFDYYQLVLPSLAWGAAEGQGKSCGEALSFCMVARRDGEILRIEITEIKQPQQKTFIYFSVNPE